MASKYLDGLRVAILVNDDFEQVEMTRPREALENAGAETKILAPHSGQVQGMNDDARADSFPVDQTLEQADPNNFDAALIPGGVINADKLRMVEPARKFVQQFQKDGKPIAVICHGPWLLVSADLVRGRTLTSYYTLQDDIRNAGGNWVDQECVRDGNWVSSRSPDDIPAFNKAMLELFAEGRRSSNTFTPQAQAVEVGAR